MKLYNYIFCCVSELYYGGEGLTVEQPQAFTCPFCGKQGLTEATLQEHVTAEHADMTFEVVCPVCASLPGGDPNHVTDDFAAHLTLEHRSGPRDLISFLISFSYLLIQPNIYFFFFNNPQKILLVNCQA